MGDFGDEIRAAALSLDRPAVFREGQLCARCLGRLFAKIGKGFSNSARGEAVGEIIGYKFASSTDCKLCGGVLDTLERLKEKALREMWPWEHSTFLIGSRFDPQILEAEEAMWSRLGTLHHEPIKVEFNRELGKAIAASSGKGVDFERPELTLIVDPTYETVDVQVAALFIKGRYRKLVRGIPQTRWPCKACMGKGCKRCEGTGKMYQTSVEEIIASKLMPMANASAHFFHGMGREDIDALMLGEGRPFILELREPHRRALDLAEAERQINASGEGVEAIGLEFALSTEVAALKEERRDKKYRVFVKFDGDVGEEKLKEGVSALRGSRIVQQTPVRVVHRRADIARHRTVHDIAVESHGAEGAVLLVTAETGTYIKELVTGDGGRTKPSLTELLGVRCTVEALDVLAVGPEREGEKEKGVGDGKGL